jgi:hypothetical protein
MPLQGVVDWARSWTCSKVWPVFISGYHWFLHCKIWGWTERGVKERNSCRSTSNAEYQQRNVPPCQHSTSYNHTHELLTENHTHEVGCCCPQNFVAWCFSLICFCMLELLLMSWRGDHWGNIWLYRHTYIHNLLVIHRGGSGRFGYGNGRSFHNWFGCNIYTNCKPVVKHRFWFDEIVLWGA